MRPNGLPDLLARLDKRPDGCWVYIGQRTRRMGYGAISYRGAPWRAHRLAYTLLVGPIPDGMQALHKCDNPPCCNPEHLYLGTPVENGRDKVERNRAARGARNHIHQHPEIVRGERNGFARLDELAVLEIRRIYTDGAPLQSIADLFEISKTQALNVATGRQWSHVPGPVGQPRGRGRRVDLQYVAATRAKCVLAILEE